MASTFSAVLISAADAAERGIKDGVWVKVFNIAEVSKRTRESLTT
jgi:anaerobic selenocysteine-containing dehydrogenase